MQIIGKIICGTIGVAMGHFFIDTKKDDEPEKNVLTEGKKRAKDEGKIHAKVENKPEVFGDYVKDEPEPEIKPDEIIQNTYDQPDFNGDLGIGDPAQGDEI